MSMVAPVATSIDRELIAAVVRGMLETTRLRALAFGPALFGDPSWSIMLELTLARAEGRQLLHSNARLLGGASYSNGARLIDQLCGRGLAEVETHRARNRHVGLTDRGWHAMVDWLVRGADEQTALVRLRAAARAADRAAAPIAATDQIDLEDYLSSAAPGTGRRPEAASHPHLDTPATVIAGVSAPEGRPSRNADPAGRRGARGRQPETASP